MSQTTCPQCGREFVEVVKHWSQSSTCDHQPFTQHQKELLKGLVMGDGSLSKPDSGHSRMTVSSTNERFLRWLRAQFGIHGTEVWLYQTGEELGEQAEKQPQFDDSGGEWEYSDIYRFDLRAHPFLTQMRERWYPNGDIRYPANLVLTPAAANMWYCSDGGLSWSDREHAHAAFGSHNEASRNEALCQLFTDHGFSPSWSEPLVRFTTAETRELLKWMAPAPAGHEYKWECDDRDRYDVLKAEVCR